MKLESNRGAVVFKQLSQLQLSYLCLCLCVVPLLTALSHIWTPPLLIVPAVLVHQVRVHPVEARRSAAGRHDRQREKDQCKKIKLNKDAVKSWQQVSGRAVGQGSTTTAPAGRIINRTGRPRAAAKRRTPREVVSGSAFQNKSSC